MSLLARFLDTAEARGEAHAVVARGCRHSYRDLRSLTLRVARHLVEQGLEPGDRVGLVVANSFEYIAVFYGIWAAGGVTVALNTQAKSQDLKNWLDHAGARFLFADDGHAEVDALCRLAGFRVPVLRIPRREAADDHPEFEHWNALRSSQETSHPVLPPDEAIASIIYTSGTTGSPKGVTLSHRNLESNTDSIRQYLSLSPSDSIVNVLPFYYSYGNSVMHTHLAAGGRLVLENSLMFPQQVMRQIETERVTGFSGVPATYSLLVSRINFGDFDLSSLRYITQAGGPMAPAITDKLTRALPDTDIYIMYGQTEASARLSYLPPRDLHRKRGSIGFAIPGVRLEIRDNAGNPVPAGERGEICAHGPNVMLGYWKDQAATEKVLRDGWLRTGDLAHADAEGYLYIDGRSADMIKSGGNRISPQEIEEVIQELDGIREVAVIGVPDELLGEVILALVVPDVNDPPDGMAVQRHCRQRLAVYKIPKSVEFIDSLPRTASGKIQRFLLQQRYAASVPGRTMPNERTS